MRAIMMGLALISGTFSVGVARAYYSPFYNSDSDSGSRYYYTPSYNYYSPYYSRGQSAAPVISLTLDPKEQLDSSFRIAAREDRMGDMLGFVRQGADINSSSYTGETALLYAARNCSLRVVDKLLRLGADPNQADRDGNTPLINATKEDCLPVVKRLLKIPGINVAAIDGDQKSALDYAGPSFEIAEALRAAEHKHTRSRDANARR